MSLPSVAIVGINGFIAKNVINAVLSPIFKDKIAFPVRLITRDIAKTAALPIVAASPDSFKLYKADIETGEGLAAAFEGVTTVVDTVGVSTFSHDKIADAAAAAGVAVYVPSEFGSDTASETGLGKYRAIFGAKLAATAHARSKPFKTVAIITGLFTEFAFAVPGLAFSSDSALTTYAPDADYATTSLPDIGRAVAAVVAASTAPASLPEVLYIRGDVVSGKKLAEIYTKVTGKEVAVTVEPTEKIVAPADKIVEVGYPKSPEDFYVILKATFSQGFGNVSPNYESVIKGAFTFETAEQVATRLFK